jgi:hypothetical protein
MADLPFEEHSEELWAFPDVDGPINSRPPTEWFSRSKSLLPACRHCRESVGSSTWSWCSRPRGSTGR